MLKKTTHGPGKWIEQLLQGGKLGAVGIVQSLEDLGKETANELLAKAQEAVSSFSFIIATTGEVGSGKPLRGMNPGSGVIVRLRGNMYGILTAGHVLKRDDNAGVTVLAFAQDWNHGGAIRCIELPPKACMIDGLDNEDAKGPDIAILPLSNGEWGSLNNWGMVAYNLDKQRLSDEDKAALRGRNPCFVSIINGVRYEASQIVNRHTNGEQLKVAMMASNTEVRFSGEREGYDFLELPSKTSERSYPAHWKEELPGTAAAEIDELHDEGVTHRVWGGISGAGVWNIVVGTNQEGLPHGPVFRELAGICFYADSVKGNIIAHGTKSIAKIAARHLENEAKRYHSKA